VRSPSSPCAVGGKVLARNVGDPELPNLKRGLARMIKPKGDSGVSLETLEDFVKFISSISRGSKRCHAAILGSLRPGDLKAARSGKRMHIGGDPSSRDHSAQR
jgi:hypothetical protein